MLINYLEPVSFLDCSTTGVTCHVNSNDEHNEVNVSWTTSIDDPYSIIIFLRFYHVVCNCPASNYYSHEEVCVAILVYYTDASKMCH